MDPWVACQTDVKILDFPLSLKFEDNFSPSIHQALPDSAEYLAALEEKIRRIRNDSNILRQLAEKREACMQQLLSGEDVINDNLILDSPLNNTAILRTILPHKQALNLGEIVELIKYDQLATDPNNTDIPNVADENRSP